MTYTTNKVPMPNLGILIGTMALQSPNSGKDIPNQVVNLFEEGKVFVSYSSIIAVVRYDDSPIILGNDWDYSPTTSKYRNIFLGNTKSDVIKWLKSGEYVLGDF